MCQMNADGLGVQALLADTVRSVASLVDVYSSVASRIMSLEAALKTSTFMNNKVPVYYWGVFSTYAQVRVWDW